MVQRTYIECDGCKKTTSPPNHFQIRIDGETNTKDLCIECWHKFVHILGWLGIPHTRSSLSLRRPLQIVIDRSYLDTGCNKGET